MVIKHLSWGWFQVIFDDTNFGQTIVITTTPPKRLKGHWASILNEYQ